MNKALRPRLTAQSILSAAIGPVARGSGQLVTFLLTLVAMRYLDPAEFGAFALAVIATTVIRTLLYTGAFEFLLKTPDPRDGSSEALCLNMIIAVVSSAIVGVACVGALAYGVDDGIVFLLVVLLPSNLISAFGAWQESLLLRTGRITSYYVATFSAELLSMVVAVVLFVEGFGVLALAAQIYARNILILLLYAMIGKTILSRRFSAARLMEIVRWATPVYGSSSLGLVSNYAADILLGLFLSPAATGIYRASSRLVTAVADIVNQPTRLISMTLTSKRIAKGEDAATLWTIILSIAAVFGWSALAGLAATADLLVPTLLGADWNAAVPIVALLCIARAFTLFDSAVAPALVAHDHQHALFKLQTAMTVSLLAMMVAAAPFGLFYATIATVLAALLKSSALLILAVRLLPGSRQSLGRHLPMTLAPAGVVALVSLLASIVTVQFVLSPYWQIALVLLVAAFAWIGCLGLLRRRIETAIGSVNG